MQPPGGTISLSARNREGGAPASGSDLPGSRWGAEGGIGAAKASSLLADAPSPSAQQRQRGWQPASYPDAKRGSSEYAEPAGKPHKGLVEASRSPLANIVPNRLGSRSSEAHWATHGKRPGVRLASRCPQQPWHEPAQPQHAAALPHHSNHPPAPTNEGEDCLEVQQSAASSNRSEAYMPQDHALSEDLRAFNAPIPVTAMLSVLSVTHNSPKRLRRPRISDRSQVDSSRPSLFHREEHDMDDACPEAPLIADLPPQLTFGPASPQSDGRHPGTPHNEPEFPANRQQRNAEGDIYSTANLRSVETSRHPDHVPHLPESQARLQPQAQAQHEQHDDSTAHHASDGETDHPAHGATHSHDEAALAAIAARLASAAAGSLCVTSLTVPLGSSLVDEDAQHGCLTPKSAEQHLPSGSAEVVQQPSEHGPSRSLYSAVDAIGAQSHQDDPASLHGNPSGHGVEDCQNSMQSAAHRGAAAGRSHWVQRILEHPHGSVLNNEQEIATPDRGKPAKSLRQMGADASMCFAADSLRQHNPVADSWDVLRASTSTSRPRHAVHDKILMQSCSSSTELAAVTITAAPPAGIVDADMLHGSAALVADHFGRAEAGSELQQGAEDSRAERSAPPRFVPALNLGRASRREGEVEETGVDSPNGGWQDLRVDGGDLSPLERATHRDGASLDNQPASARAQHITLHRALGVQTRPLQGGDYQQSTPSQPAVHFCRRPDPRAELSHQAADPGGDHPQRADHARWLHGHGADTAAFGHGRMHTRVVTTPSQEPPVTAATGPRGCSAAGALIPVSAHQSDVSEPLLAAGRQSNRRSKLGSAAARAGQHSSPHPRAASRLASPRLVAGLTGSPQNARFRSRGSPQLVPGINGSPRNGTHYSRRVQQSGARLARATRLAPSPVRAMDADERNQSWSQRAERAATPRAAEKPASSYQQQRHAAGAREAALANNAGRSHADSAKFSKHAEQAGQPRTTTPQCLQRRPASQPRHRHRARVLSSPSDRSTTKHNSRYSAGSEANSGDEWDAQPSATNDLIRPVNGQAFAAATAVPAEASKEQRLQASLHATAGSEEQGPQASLPATAGCAARARHPAAALPQACRVPLHATARPSSLSRTMEAEAHKLKGGSPKAAPADGQLRAVQHARQPASPAAEPTEPVRGGSSHSKQSTKAGGPFPRPWQLPQSEPPLTTHTLRHEEAFAGRGMSIATVNKEDVHRRREMGRLMTENEDLKDEVQYLRRLLKITQPETLATQTQEPSKSEPPTTAKPAVRSLFPAADGDAGGVGRALSREQMLKLHNVQLERQLLKADGELRARQEVAAAANTVLAELQQRLQQALPRDADAGGDLERMVAADELLKLRQWAADTMTSLKQVRRAAHTVDAAPHEASMSPNAETQGTMGTVAWEIPFLSTAGGGNVFMPAGATPTVTGICRGEGVLLADPAKVQQLEAQLGALAPQLAALCESLQSTLLPALPSLCPPLAARLKVDTRRAVTAVAEASHLLTQLACLLPSAEPTQPASTWQPSQARLHAASGGQKKAGAGPEAASKADVRLEAKRVAEQLVGIANAQDRAHAVRVLEAALTRCRREQEAAERRTAVLEAELDFHSHTIAAQAQHCASLFAACREVLDDFSHDVGENVSKACASLLRVLGAHQKLERSPSEAALKQLVSLMHLHAPLMQQIPGMLTGPTPASNAAQQVQGALDTLQQRYDMALHRLRQARQGQIAALAQSAT